MYSTKRAVGIAIAAHLPEWLNEALAGEELVGVEEIRVRAGKPIQLVYPTRDRLLPVEPDMAMCALMNEFICEHSVPSMERQLSGGYVTLRGCRVGVCGKAVMKPEGGIARFEYVNGFNIRIAREVKGCARDVMDVLYDDNTCAVRSALVLSAPGGGKTTLLRDIARCLSDGWGGHRGVKVCIADERGELAGELGGMPLFDTGSRTDVIQGCLKSDAILSFIRSMSPDVIITDELGCREDAQAVLLARASGISVIASAHAKDSAGARTKRYIGELMDEGCFDVYVKLKRERGGFSARPVRANAV